MAATLSRSTRRTEVHHVSPHQHPSLAAAAQQAVANARRNALGLNANPTTRTKRNLEPPEVDFDAFKSKKPRFSGITVEIPARPPPPPPSKLAADYDAKPDLHGRPAGAAHVVPSRLPAHLATTTEATKATALPQRQNTVQSKHQKKVANSLRHELNDLQPRQDVVQEPAGRKLRSQEATRFKSELSKYFPDEYDEVIGNDPKENHILNLDTPIIIVDSQSDSGKKLRRAVTQPTSEEATSPRPRSSRVAHPVRGYSDALFTDLCDSQQFSLSFLEVEPRNKSKALVDGLPDSLYQPIHRKEQRAEQKTRNNDKSHAQHEKEVIIRLLDGLQGPDWLRVLGVSGITESKKKTFEPARAHFIKGCKSILDKFRAWAAEEKRRKLEKERALAEAEATEEDEEEDEEDDDGGDVSEEEIADSEDDESEIDQRSERGRYDEPRDSSDVDASVAKQLREEALAAAKTKQRGRTGTRRVPLNQQPEPEPEVYRPFTSFFDKKYQRDAALSTNRRKGRSVMAWGHAVPDVAERDFELPEEYRDEETLKANARRKRREKRHKE